ncbi:hypothetical protein IWQ62_000872, partial [Dispira parvispora]
MDNLSQEFRPVKSSVRASKGTSTTSGFAATSWLVQASKGYVVSSNLDQRPDGSSTELDTFIPATTTGGNDSTLESFTEKMHTRGLHCLDTTDEASCLPTSGTLTTGGTDKPTGQLPISETATSLEISSTRRRVPQKTNSTGGYSTHTGQDASVDVTGTLCALYESRVTCGDVGLCALDWSTGRCTLAQVLVVKRAPTDGPSYLLTSLSNFSKAPFSILPAERRLFRSEQGLHYVKNLHTESPDKGLAVTLTEQELGNWQLGLACVGAVFGQLEQVQGQTMGPHSIHFSLESGKARLLRASILQPFY